MRHARFDRSLLRLRPIAERTHDLGLAVLKELRPVQEVPPALAAVAQRIAQAREKGAAVALMLGGHVVRSGVQRHLIDLMQRGYITCLAMNGAVMIHDFELALIGATTESVSRYIRDGRFGLWEETGRINDLVNRAHAADPGCGMGEAVGRAIAEQGLPHADVSLLAAAWRLGVAATVHIGMGHDIIHEHPNFDPVAAGATSYTDFLIFTAQLDRLENGVVMNFGSAVMAPEVYLKALSMARNVATTQGREIRRFCTLVCDLQDLPEACSLEPGKSDPRYYFRPWKTMLARTVQDGGESHYVRGRHEHTIPALWTALTQGR